MKFFKSIYNFFRYSREGKELTFIERRKHNKGKCPYCDSTNREHVSRDYNKTHDVNDLLNIKYTCKYCGFTVNERFHFTDYEYMNCGFSLSLEMKRILKLKKLIGNHEQKNK